MKKYGNIVAIAYMFLANYFLYTFYENIEQTAAMPPIAVWALAPFAAAFLGGILQQTHQIVKICSGRYGKGFARENFIFFLVFCILGLSKLWMVTIFSALPPGGFVLSLMDARLLDVVFAFCAGRYLIKSIKTKERENK